MTEAGSSTPASFFIFMLGYKLCQNHVAAPTPHSLKLRN